MQDQINQLTLQVQELTAIVNSLRADATIPYDIGEAFKVRLGGNVLAGVPNGGTNTTSVNEAGSGTYFVAAAMTGTVPLIIEGVQYNLPYY